MPLRQGESMNDLDKLKEIGKRLKKLFNITPEKIQKALEEERETQRYRAL
jgi:hypothetical protein